MVYIDGFVIAGPTANKTTFPEHARKADAAFIDCGATMEKVMEDPRLDPKTNPMPFDAMRMIYGGFMPVVDLGASS